MLRKLKFFAPLALTLTVPAAAFAGSSSYLCTLDHRSNYAVLIEADPELGSARVYDDHMAHLDRQPAQARFSGTKDGKYLLRWKVKGLPGTLTRESDSVVVSRTKVKITVSAHLEVDRQFSKMQFRERVHGGRGWSDWKSGSCRAIRGSIENYINR